MSKIISFVSQKGGVGKSTLACNLAAFFVKNNLSIAIIDADKQSSTANWLLRSKQKNISLYQEYEDELLKKVNEIKDSYDFIIIDVVGKDSNELRLSVGISDIVVTPTGPSHVDLETLIKLKDIIKSIEMIKGKPIEHKIIINRVPHLIGSEEQKSRDFIKEHSLVAMDSIIHERKIFRDALEKGESIFDSKNKKAINEFISFTKELIGIK